jgi:glycosyltransferase involved in cell wall biosynthesis
MPMRKLPVAAIVGTAGVPANYGGFETLAENLVRENQKQGSQAHFVVYCSTRNYEVRPDSFCDAELRYINVNPNGILSVLYDALSMLSAVARGADVMFVLGVSGCIALPLVRLFSKTKIITNIDGIEWRREKWNWAARSLLRLSEKLAVRFSHELIADNEGIARHVGDTYGKRSHVIAYGGDHAISMQAKPYRHPALEEPYALALCRIEPENNVEMILEAFSKDPCLSLVFVGNWDYSQYGQELKQRYGASKKIFLLDPVYDIGILRTLRSNASLYIHGHSAGGTNPSLVEVMHFGIPIIAFDVGFNRFTTEDKALYFGDAESLRSIVASHSSADDGEVGHEMLRIARERYTWKRVYASYMGLI